MKKKQRIAVVGNMATTLINFRSNLIESMVINGHKVYAFVPDYVESTRKQIRDIGAVPVDFTLSRTGLNPFRDIKDIVSLSLKLRLLNIEIVFSYFIKPVIYGSIAANFAGVKRIYSLIGGLGYLFTDGEDFNSIKRKVLRNIALKLYSYSLDKNLYVFIQNPDDIEYFIKNRILSHNKVVRINGSGVDVNYFKQVTPIINPITFTLVARLLTEKGIREYVAAAKIVKEKYPNTRFILIGGIDINPGGISIKEVTRWVDMGYIQWLGQVSNVYSWLCQTSVFVLPSYREGTPRSSLEAMSTGLPIITTDVPGCRETVLDGVNGVLIPAKSVDALSEAMFSFIDNPERIFEMGQQSRMIAEDVYDVMKVNHVIMTNMNLY